MEEPMGWMLACGARVSSILGVCVACFRVYFRETWRVFHVPWQVLLIWVYSFVNPVLRKGKTRPPKLGSLVRATDHDAPGGFVWLQFEPFGTGIGSVRTRTWALESHGRVRQRRDVR